MSSCHCLCSMIVLIVMSNFTQTNDSLNNLLVSKGKYASIFWVVMKLQIILSSFNKSKYFTTCLWILSFNVHFIYLFYVVQNICIAFIVLNWFWGYFLSGSTGSDMVFWILCIEQGLQVFRNSIIFSIDFIYYHKYLAKFCRFLMWFLGNFI